MIQYDTLHDTSWYMYHQRARWYIDDTWWYICINRGRSWYSTWMIHCINSAQVACGLEVTMLIHCWYIDNTSMIQCINPRRCHRPHSRVDTSLIHGWYIVSTLPTLRVGGDYVDTLLIHTLDNTMYHLCPGCWLEVTCWYIVDTLMIQCINPRRCHRPHSRVDTFIIHLQYSVNT